MSLDNRPIYTGGCQCGAVRFRVEGALGDASVCHCRMCQKAFGAFYAPLVSVRGARLDWTRGQPKYFRSSNHVKRGFCADCGTPLTFTAPDGIGAGHRRLRRSGGDRAADPVGHRGKAALCRHHPAIARRGHDRPIRRRRPISPISSPTSIPITTPNNGRQRKDHDRNRSNRRLPVRRRALSAFTERSGARPSAIAACARKQFGSFFGALVTVPSDGVEWMREEPSYFQSSVNIDRGFCARCGTPLTYRQPAALEIAIGAFDDRSDLAPQIQVNYAARLPWVETIFDKPVDQDPDRYATPGTDHLLPASRPRHRRTGRRKGLQL